MKMDSAVEVISKVFEDMDKDFTIWEYRREIKELLKAGIFVTHINNHFKEDHPLWEVRCKICAKSIDEIIEKVGIKE